jgi:hypothetical protein
LLRVPDKNIHALRKRPRPTREGDTLLLPMRRRGHSSFAGARSRHPAGAARRYIACRAEMEREIVTSSAYSRSLPTGIPKAIRETLTLRGLRSLER